MRKELIKREDGSVYLVRYHIFHSKYINIMVHHILQSDTDCMHDHPWDFVSIILKGGYVEYYDESHFYEAKDGLLVRIPIVKSKIVHPFTFNFRPAKWIHRLEIHQDCWTLVMTFGRKRDWGFWTPRGWKFWEDYKSIGSCE